MELFALLKVNALALWCAVFSGSSPLARSSWHFLDLVSLSVAPLSTLCTSVAVLSKYLALVLLIGIKLLW